MTASLNQSGSEVGCCMGSPAGVMDFESACALPVIAGGLPGGFLFRTMNKDRDKRWPYADLRCSAEKGARTLLSASSKQAVAIAPRAHTQRRKERGHSCP